MSKAAECGRKVIGGAILTLSMCFVCLSAEKGGAGMRDAQALTNATGIRGGLCVLVGAKDTALANALAGQGSFYVQALQPDAKVAAQWGLAVASSTNRENIGIRNAAFDPVQYDFDLFNLIVVEDASALGATRCAELFRILVPNGCVAFRAAPAGIAADAQTLKMTAAQATGWQVVLKKPAPPVEWRPHLVRKWSAEPNDHTCGGFTGMTSGGGRFFYREMMEVEGEQWKNGRSQLFARDAYNGRMLWTLEEPVGWNPGWMADLRAPNWGLAADNMGRLFATTGDGQLVCLDADTGKQRFVLMDKGAGGKIEVYGDKYVIACGKVFSAEDGKLLWTLPRLASLGMHFPIMSGPLYAVEGDTIFFCTGQGKTLTLNVGKLADGRTQKFSLEGLPSPENYSGVILSGRHLLICTDRQISSVDGTTGKALGSWPWPAPVAGYGYYQLMPDGDKLLFASRQPKEKLNGFHLTRLDLVTGKVDPENTFSNMMEGCNFACGAFRGNLGDYWVTAWNWFNKKTLENTPCGMSGGPCGLCQIPARDAPLIFVMPSRKNRWVTGDASVAAGAETPKGPGWTNLQRFAQAMSSEPTAEGDWPAFRGSATMGNSTRTVLGDKLAKAWETQIGLGGKTFGMMSGRHIGLTQAVIAYGLAIVSDIEGQRIVAVDAADGKTKWVFHVGSRADYPPTLCKGLCLFAAKDGWVYCLDAMTGALVWKNLVPAAERYIGGCEQLVSPFIQTYWAGENLNQNVQVVDGLGHVYCDADDPRKERFFKLETGELVNPAPRKAPAGGFDKLTAGKRLANDPGGRELAERFLKGQSLPRQFAENSYPVLNDGKNKGQVLAFDDALSVAFNCGYGERDWKTAAISLTAATNAITPKAPPLWTSTNLEMVVDDILLTPQHVYCVGHYQRSDKARSPELLVMSREDGKVVNTIPVDGFPAFLGMSAAGNRLFIATREGRLVCYQGWK